MFEINSPFTMVVFIVLIAVGAGVVNNWIKTRGNREADEAAQEEMFRLRKDVERLTERVRVLETIATDKDERLREEIRRLA
jgi:ABC-type multidrug transport system fused ATPase/permease subunit